MLNAALIVGLSVSLVILVICWIPNKRLFRRDLDEWGTLEGSPWISWGDVLDRNGRLVTTYLFFRLPSYRMMEDYLSRGMCWHCLCVCWSGQRGWVCQWSRDP